MAKNMRPAETRNDVGGSGRGVVTSVQTSGTSTRCRATHDVPYTLRCVLEASHAWTLVRHAVADGGETVAVLEMHKDKEGNRW